tara:strand:+ start:399 stop:671 length:273 start_codon:yes stop_codon:yes gene_type:complete
MTDDQSMDELIELITMPANERKDLILKPLYGVGENEELDGFKHTRIAERPCPQCKKRGKLSYSRRPCRLLQYLESCNTCDYRIGDTPYPV